MNKRAARLADELRNVGKLHSDEWWGVFARTPRHVFLPRFYRQEHSDRAAQWVQVSSAADRESWLDEVYANATHVTELDPATCRQVPGGFIGTPTSSSTLPEVMASMLEQLDLRDGMRVLEIGTGTGYNAALLCERLGSENVTTIDIDPRLVADARERLAESGYHPKVEVADGAEGFADGAPYDRIIATCSVPRIPPAWIAQLRDGGIMLADLRRNVGGALAWLVRHNENEASGFFPRDGAMFMAMRADARSYPASGPYVPPERPAHVGSTTVPPMRLYDPKFSFVAWLHLPDARLLIETTDDGAQRAVLRDGVSWAAATVEPTERGAWIVEQDGPRKLWDVVEDAHNWWLDQDMPGWECFGVSVRDREHRIWHNTPDRHDCWTLP